MVGSVIAVSVMAGSVMDGSVMDGSVMDGNFTLCAYATRLGCPAGFADIALAGRSAA
jgi:hypothetical protein